MVVQAGVAGQATAIVVDGRIVLPGERRCRLGDRHRPYLVNAADQRVARVSPQRAYHSRGGATGARRAPSLDLRPISARTPACFDRIDADPAFRTGNDREIPIGDRQVDRYPATARRLAE